jgi:flavin-dependent dehydrogenase
MGSPEQFDLLVIGAGPAGAAAAITAARAGMKVALLEKGSFPRHRVCGEFVSPESLALLRDLLGGHASLFDAAPRLTSARIFADDQIATAPVDPAAASIRRYEMDAALWRAGQDAGADCRAQAPVRSITRTADGFAVSTGSASLHARVVIDATGRWSNLRAESQPLPPGPRWIGIKQHFAEDAPPLSTDLYFFEGGYCGVQPVARGRINVCAMVRADVATSLPQVMAQHPALWRRSRTWEPLTEMAPITTSPLVFRKNEPVRAGILQVGDAAGFIDPFVGDGISLALRSGTLAAECVLRKTNAEASAAEYAAMYREQLGGPFRMASRIRVLTAMPRVIRAIAMYVLNRPRWSQYVVRRTR